MNSMVIFNSYVKLPEGKTQFFLQINNPIGPSHQHFDMGFQPKNQISRTLTLNESQKIFFGVLLEHMEVS